jgi:hypothetical protein
MHWINNWIQIIKKKMSLINVSQYNRKDNTKNYWNDCQILVDDWNNNTTHYTV